MEIKLKTKFNVGDTLFFYNPLTSKLEEFKVSFVNVNAYADKTVITYFDESDSCKLEQNLFPSKEAFIANL